MLKRPRLPVPMVTPAQREILLGWARRPTSARGLALRARMILRLADGHSSAAVARQIQVHIQTVSKWMERFHSHGVDDFRLNLKYQAAPGLSLSNSTASE